MKYSVEEGRDRERKSYYIDVEGVPQAFIAAGIFVRLVGILSPYGILFSRALWKSERERERRMGD